MPHTIAEIAAALRAEAAGDLTLTVTHAAEPGAAGADALALAMSPSFLGDLSPGGARAAVVPPGTDWAALGLRAVIFAPRARLALSRLTGLMADDRAFGPGIHPSAVIEEGADIAADATIGPFTWIGAGARIGAGCRIGAQVSIAPGVVIGAGGRIHAGARVQPGCRIGARVVIQPGAVIGADGFSFVTEEPSNPEIAKSTGGAERLGKGAAPWHKTESLGAVEIGDDVEIGANSTIDAGTIRPTRVGRGTKLDNLVHLGHNVVVGTDCLLCGQTGIAGSVEIGNRVVLGGQTGVGDHHRIGDDVVTGAGTMILSNVPAGRVLLGYPAQRMDQSIAAYKALRRLVRGGWTQKAVSKPRGDD